MFGVVSREEFGPFKESVDGCLRELGTAIVHQDKSFEKFEESQGKLFDAHNELVKGLRDMQRELQTLTDRVRQLESSDLPDRVSVAERQLRDSGSVVNKLQSTVLSADSNSRELNVSRRLLDLEDKLGKMRELSKSIISEARDAVRSTVSYELSVFDARIQALESPVETECV